MTTGDTTKARARKTSSKSIGASGSATDGKTSTSEVDVTLSEIALKPDYRPSEAEPFMCDLHKAYFRRKLEDWRTDIIRQTRETLAGLTVENAQHADLADRASSETDRALELRARGRQRKLVSKIDAAIKRIDDGDYGYCNESGEPISLRRLEARPIATLSIEAQERHERREKVYRDD